MSAELPAVFGVSLDVSTCQCIAEHLAHRLDYSGAKYETNTLLDPNRWMNTAEAAEYAGTTKSSIYKATAARTIGFKQAEPNGTMWFQCIDIDRWRRGEPPR